MSIYRDSEGREARLIRFYKRNTQMWVTYRPLNLAYNCTMSRDDFYRDFKLVQDVAEGQQS